MDDNFVLDDLINRKIINNITSKEKLNNAVALKSSIYCGFDPSAKSLHLGNYAQIIGLKLFAKLGLKPICVLGTGTGLIGDPSGKSSERNLLDKKTFNENVLNISKQLNFFFADKNNEIILENDSWYKNINIIDFLRDIGKYINISQIIHKENIAKRIETGISFTEFSYQMLQAWDFYYLYKNYNCFLQLGGSDQWGNITTGIELIRKIKNEGDENAAAGITLNLLTKDNGEKFGKTVSGAIYLDKSLTSPYQMYHFLFNQPDNIIETLFNSLTVLTNKNIKDIMSKHLSMPKLRFAQKELAKEIILNIHGEKAFKNVLDISKNLYTKSFSELTAIELNNLYENILKINSNGDLNLTVKDLLMTNNIFNSNRELNEFFNSKAIKINGITATNLNDKLANLKYLDNMYLIIQKGKHLFWIYKKN